MSWSVNAVGKPAAVAERVARDLSQYKCIEPEESVKQAVGLALAAVLAAQDPASAVIVQASGHQADAYGPERNITGHVNTLNVKVEPIAGFLE